MRAVIVALGLLLLGCPRGPASEGALRVVQAEQVIAAPAAGRVVIDVRSAEAFAAGHVPGAVHLDVKALRAEVDGVAEQLAPRASVAAVLGALGVDPGDEVIVVDEGSTPAAARVVWTLLYFGHPPARVRMLDGGWAAWVAAKGPQSAGAAEVVASEAAAVGEARPELRVDAAWVLAHLGDPQVLLVDVRSDEEWSAGRIPGAQHVEWKRARGADGRLLAEPGLRELYARALASPTVAVYCKSGMRASLTWLVLATLGHPDVRVYDGSWNEWGARPELPKEG
ncbi:MAG: sulfurtransferase [Myxococcales bacterium]|nr:sulfurtransferase [Myxococcales bacterium]